MTGKFVLETRETEDGDKYLRIAVELLPGIEPDETMAPVIAESIRAQLLRLNSEFANYHFRTICHTHGRKCCDILRKRSKQVKELQEKPVVNVKRAIINSHDWEKGTTQGPYFIFNTLEIKTAWRPVESTGSGNGGY